MTPTQGEDTPEAARPDRVLRPELRRPLLFDEAEPLRGRRTEIRDAHDRYAAIEDPD